MVRHHKWDAVEVMEILPSEFFQRRVLSRYDVSGNAANAKKESRPHNRDLPQQDREVRLDFVGFRIAILRWAALQDIHDEDFIPRKIDCCENLVEQSAGPPHERFPFLVFVGARSFADHHQIGVRIADPRHWIDSCFVDWHKDVARDIFSDLLERG